ncbi:membrane protein insertase YidC [Ferrimonas balearica]|uniref:membrane protein insertase YidC n=1 Tax=Ferrimonas balearica TaxID=44012 RepID=UPI001C98F73D|nr:membrane protein insertase YidC [Ferrimonas balearica]MBY5923467.1 membrane protein insertase YidC [Ferrimonas balearica]MBY5997846.1 membrane protein insertase YidC [Ferrimonas balearica]
MDSQRNLILIGLLFVSFLLWQQWTLDQAPQAETPASQTVATADKANDVPQSATNSQAPSGETVSDRLIQVKTDTLNVTIDATGGDVVFASLPEYKVEQGGEEALTILENESGFSYIAQSGLIGLNGPHASGQRPVYQVQGNDFQMKEGQDTLVVPLIYTDANGVQFEKRYTFTRGHYDVRVDYVVKNDSGAPIQVQMYSQLKQTIGQSEGSMMMPTYRGGAYSTADTRYEKYAFDKMEKNNLAERTQGGWIAMLQHYFVSAWVPSADSSNDIYSNVVGGDAIIGVKQPAVQIAAGAEQTMGATLYVGPKNQEALSALSPTLNLVVDYGWLWFIAQPLHSLLMFLQSLVSNWGVAIILMTLIIRGFMYPLTKAQYTSMAKMRKLQPKLADLKERFGDDRQRMSQAMMELYQKEKVNPMGGCLPLLLQFPIFIAFYWVLLESVELRHAPFFGWITDLSVKDPYYVLPILMGISMFAMQKMQPTMATMDPMQQKIMQYMPVMFTVFFLWFPSGLVLYWLVGNLVAIAQQLFIYRSLEKQGLK